jgi:hypothetical protein
MTSGLPLITGIVTVLACCGKVCSVKDCRAFELVAHLFLLELPFCFEPKVTFHAVRLDPEIAVAKGLTLIDTGW